MDIKTSKDIYGRDFKYMKCGLVKGRNILVKNGYTQCDNHLYFKKDNEYFHYNKLLNAWLHEIDNKIEISA